ncbi:putative cadmium-transporting ATPase [Roseimaritima multifibrata]|uniref:P-type Zn(2+) transporter n=1 Tax=Roseimaritima multifibrata TaxID=1930274 RepID=A0A517MHD3_9BACT|nr:heavy metal translocating P-type ATPase [Roseimaritima multifibrata]QDS94293.1 putative cadmium-transporting ATPase [Roseimaritima multifibrata]
MNDTKNSLLELRVTGMCCVEEVSMLKRELVPMLESEEQLRFDLLAGKLSVDMTSTDASPADMIAAVKRTGMKAEFWKDEKSAQQNASLWQRHQRSILTTLSGLMILVGLVLELVVWADAEQTPLLAIGFYLFAVLSGLVLVLPKAWRSLSALRPDMNLLMSVAVVGAMLIGEWFEAATVAFLFSLSLLLESWSIGRARRAISALMDLTPLIAHLRSEDGTVKDVDPATVAVGSVLMVRSGEKIPLDGHVIQGASAIDQSPITGESMPVEKTVDDKVFAGTINGDGLLTIETEKAAEDTTLARIIKMVDSASSNRAPSERWVEKFASIYTPVVMATAFAILVIPPLLFAGEWSEWLYRALVLLVIACPCALVISTPVSVVAALASAARHGVLIKGGGFVEVPASLRAVAMDKTGTLTHGQPKVMDVIPMGGHDSAKLLSLAGALEANSNHPLARAIVAEAESRGLKFDAADDLATIPGKGVAGTIEGEEYWLGSPRFLESHDLDNTDVRSHLETMQMKGRSVVLVGTGEHVCGILSLADTVRDETIEAIRSLHAVGIEHVVMLTGDNLGTANAIAAEAGIDEVHAELLPEDKVAAVEQLVAQYGQVAMIGDGVNDAPALARSSLGIAMGAAGTDAAIEIADVALMSDDLSKLPWLVQHSRRTLRIIRQNIGFSLGIKLLFVILTFFGFSSLWAAIAADMGTSFLVIANGLRLLRN